MATVPSLIERNELTSSVRIAANTTVVRDRQRRQPRDRPRRVAALGMPQVPILLQTEPEGSARTRHALQTQRRIGRHTPPTTYDAIETLERDAELPRERDLTDA